MPSNITRRRFLQQSSALSLTGLATPWALNLAALGSAATAAEDDYKALVCIFLTGGNDHANTVVPFDTPNYDIYRGVRHVMGWEKERDGLLPLDPLEPLADGRQYALAPRLPKLHALFHANEQRSGKVAVLLNVGTLTQPIANKQQLFNPAFLPPKLYSHNDQQAVWQSQHPEGAITGWGGLMADQASSNPANPFTCINVALDAPFLSGITASQFKVSTEVGAIELTAGSQLFDSPECSAALKRIMTEPGPQGHRLAAHHARISARALDAGVQLNAALTRARSFATPRPAGDLSDQLLQVARIISIAGELGVRRQVFMVTLGDFDHHHDLMEQHGPLLTQLDDAMDWFYRATEEMGMQDSITSFTASDFGRALVPNNNGCDHGWGGMHFVLGGAVRGQRYYGRPPHITFDGGVVGGDDDAGNGRLIPRTAVDEYAATLGYWFGASASNLNQIFPNLAKFTATTPPYLDFIRRQA